MASFRGAGFVALLLIALGWSMQGVAQPSDANAVPAAASPDDSSSQWNTVPHEAPPSEVSALDAEGDGEPVTAELPGLCRPVFSGTARVAPTGSVLRAAPGTYSVRFAASPVLARAPPRAER